MRSAVSACSVGLDHLVQRQVRHSRSEPVIFGFERLHLFRLRHFHAARPDPQFTENRVADPLLAIKLFRPKSGLMLVQNADDLFFREPLSLHRPFPLQATDQSQIAAVSAEQVMTNASELREQV
jgi:hypothetical protein